MRTKKTPIEIELDRYYYALSSIKIWQNEIGHITADHERKTDALSQLIENEKRILKRINDLVLASNLTGEEGTYIELKHFKKFNRIQIERAMSCCQATITRIRKSALTKIEKTYKKGD